MSARNSSVIVAVAIAAISIGFSLASCLHLRGHAVGDGIVYVPMAKWIVDGNPLSFAGFQTINGALPIGYPLIIAGMAKLGFATPAGLKAFNFTCLALGMAACWFVIRRSFELSQWASACILILFAASTTCVELSVTVCSEPAFIASSMITLWMLSLGTWRGIVGAIAAAFVAISIRTVGIALLPAIVVAAVQMPSVRRRLTLRTLLVAFVPLLICAGAGSAIVLHTRYVSDVLASAYPVHSDWAVHFQKEVCKLSAFGELATNLRAEDYPFHYRGEFVLLGTLVASLVAIGVWTRRKLAPIDVYFVFYATIIFVWPFFSYGIGRRFWVPVLPILMAYATIALSLLAARVNLPENRAAAVMMAYLVLAVASGCWHSISDSNLNRDNTEAAVALERLRGAQ